MPDTGSHHPEINVPASFETLIHKVESSIRYGVEIASLFSTAHNKEHLQLQREQTANIEERMRLVQTYCETHSDVSPDEVHRMAYSRALGNIARK